MRFQLITTHIACVRIVVVVVLLFLFLSIEKIFFIRTYNFFFLFYTFLWYFASSQCCEINDFIVIVLIDIISGIVSSYFVPRIDHGGVKFYLASEIGGIYTLEYLVWISISLDKRDRFAVVVR